MFDLIAIPFGWVMWLIYKLTSSYGVSILIFTIFIKLLTLPSTYKMQVNQARQSLIADKVAKIKKAFPNNPQRVQEEQQKLFTEEGINPSAGCLGSLVTMILILGVYRVVLQPLKFILRIPADTVSEAKDALTNWLDAHQIVEKSLTARPELILLKYAKGEYGQEIFSGIQYNVANSSGGFDKVSFVDSLMGFNNTFLGFDLTGMPSFKPEVGWCFTTVMLVLLPFFAAIVQLAMTIITQRHSRKTNPETAAQMGSMNLMLYLSPLMTVWIGLSVPAGLSFYWFLSSLFSLIIQVLLYKYLSGERLVAINVKEKEKQLKKGPTWMQKMMAQSQEYQNQQTVGGSARTNGNHTRSSDGDDGMSRKERAEYDKKLIEAARKRAAEKYGDSIQDDSNED